MYEEWNLLGTRLAFFNDDGFRGRLLLGHDFLQGGSLFHLLDDHMGVLEWLMRRRIVAGWHGRATHLRQPDTTARRASGIVSRYRTGTWSRCAHCIEKGRCNITWSFSLNRSSTAIANLTDLCHVSSLSTCAAARWPRSWRGWRPTTSCTSPAAPSSCERRALPRRCELSRDRRCPTRVGPDQLTLSLQRERHPHHARCSGPARTPTGTRRP